MSNVIGFLEKMGQDAELRHASKNEMELALADAEINPRLQAVILSSDQAQLEALLLARTNVVCGLFPGKEDDDGEEEEESPDKDDDEMTGSHAAIRRVAASS